MKLESLNIWSGMVYEPLVEHVQANQETDIFCFQEVTNGDELPEHVKKGNRNMLEAFRKILPQHNSYYSPYQLNEVGPAIFIKKNIKVDKYEETFVYRWFNARVGDDQTTLGRNVQLVEFVNEGLRYSIINFHGLWNGQGKSDTQDRLEQSKNVSKVLDGAQGKRILAGDFNLMPDTTSLSILERGMRNLVKEYGVTDTRGELYPKELRFADYILVSPDIEVINFEVLPIAVSDHLPLQLEFR